MMYNGDINGHQLFKMTSSQQEDTMNANENNPYQK